MAALGGVILAGGRSRRMGQDKSLLRLEGQTLVARVFSVLSTLCNEVVLVTNTPAQHAHVGARMLADAYPDTGSLGGMFTGLRDLQAELAVVVACDMPFLNATVLQHMAALAEGFDAVIPDLSVSAPSAGAHTAKMRELHPLHAVYRKTCLPPIESQIRSGDLRMIGFLDQVRARYLFRAEAEGIDPEFRSFMNVNTPEDWEKAERLARETL